MKFEINIENNKLQEVVKQARELHDIALHNFANSMLRNGNIDRDKEIAEATQIIYDIISVVTESIRAKEIGENPEDFDFGNVCCKYIE